jgi:hypothetical protein
MAKGQKSVVGKKRSSPAWIWFRLVLVGWYGGAVLLKFKEAKSEISETEKAIEKGGGQFARRKD